MKLTLWQRKEWDCQFYGCLLRHEVHLSCAMEEASMNEKCSLILCGVKVHVPSGKISYLCPEVYDFPGQDIRGDYLAYTRESSSSAS